MKYELLHTTVDGVDIYARIDDDGLCRVTCFENDKDYQAWLNPVEHLTEIPTKGANLATLASELSNPSTPQAGE